MAKEKQIKSRIIHKHDTEANWNKAGTFIPKQGEIIIYDIDETHSVERFKLGDGITTVVNLPFYTSAITETRIDEICGTNSFSYDENGNVQVLSLFKNSDITYDTEGNVTIA